MKTLSKYTKLFLLISLLSITLSFDTPTGWTKAGSKVQSYDMGVDTAIGIDGNKILTIKSNRTRIIGYGTLMKTISPDLYLNKRVKLSGYLKTKDVKGWTGFWLRVDDKKTGKASSFDNMSERNIEGTNDWAKYEIVLDVPSSTSKLAFGCMLAGTGQIWFEKVNIEVVDSSVPITGSENIKSKK